MLKDYRVQAVVSVWGGMFLFCFGFLVTSMHEAFYAYFGYLIMAGSYLLFVCGCVMYAKGRGHAWFLGILGILGPLGLLFLYCLKDKSKKILAQREKEEKSELF